MTDDPEVWPECSECHVAYVHRRCMTFTSNGLSWRWVWQQDCKHGRKGSTQPAPVLMTADGPYEPASIPDALDGAGT